jgi:crotonobetaine/carnitine-CoA ligase
VKAPFDSTLVALVRRQAERYGDREFLRFPDGSVTTFAGLDAESTALAQGLATKGLASGDRLLALMTAGPAFLPVLVAANKVGAVMVPVNTELRGAFLQHQVSNSAPSVIVVDIDLAHRLVDVDLGNVTTIVVAGDGEVPQELTDRSEVCDLATLREDGRHLDRPLVEPAPRDTAVVIYTSGTTGPSKGVLMPHAHALLMSYGSVTRLGITDQDTFYVCMPLFHANGLFLQVIASLWAGARAYIVPKFSASRWLEDVRSSGATVTNALGVMPEFIYRQPPTHHDADNALRTMMAVPVNPEWARDFQARFGLSVIQGYGMSEINMVAYTTPSDPLITGLAGRILDEWFELRIVDEDDYPVPPETSGEIVVRPKHPWAFMAGYQAMPAETAEAWRNLWFHTGDLGKIDAQGRLHFIDRTKDRIRRRGENISSYEVEQVVAAHPHVAECAVIGVPVADAGGEDEIKAYVVLTSGSELDHADLREHCRRLLPRFAVPRFIEVIDEVPKTPTGKPQKAPLRARGITVATWDAEGFDELAAASP